MAHRPLQWARAMHLKSSWGVWSWPLRGYVSSLRAASQKWEWNLAKWLRQSGSNSCADMHLQVLEKAPCGKYSLNSVLDVRRCAVLWALLCFCLCCASLPFLDMSVGKIVMLQQQEQVMLFTVQYGTNNPIEGLWVFSIFFNYFFLFGYRVWRRQAGVAESQCWGVALQDGAKSCRHELVFPGVPGRLNEPKLSSAGFVSLFISRQEWQFLFFILIWPLFCFLN